MTFIIAVIAGALCGVLTGAGIGGGTILVLYLTAVAGVAQGAAGGVNLLYFLVTVPPALYSHMKNKLVETKLGAYAAAGGVVTALISAFLSRNLDNDILRKIFGVLFILVGIKELFFSKKAKE